MKKILFLLLIIPLLSGSYSPDYQIPGNNENEPHAKWVSDFEKAQKLARRQDKLLLILFTGSDWCPPCKNLHKYFFDSEEFIELADKNLILYMADFPRKKDMYDAETMKTNRELKTRYKIRGFPTVVILSPAGQEVARRVGFGFDHDTQYHFKMLRQAIADYR